MTGRAAALEALREQIRVLEGGPRILRRRAPSGVATIDALTGGLPRPGIVEISGAPGTGRTRVAAQLVAACTRARRWVTWVDPQRMLHPPALADHGVELGRLLVVCPPRDGTRAGVWAIEQLLRSGCFPLVVVSLPPRSGSRRAAGHGWARAAEHGQCTALVLGDRPTRELPADVRLRVGMRGLTVVRDREGRAGARAALPPWPDGASPW